MDRDAREHRRQSSLALKGQHKVPDCSLSRMRGVRAGKSVPWDHRSRILSRHLGPHLMGLRREAPSHKVHLMAASPSPPCPVAPLVPRRKEGLRHCLRGAADSGHAMTLSRAWHQHWCYAAYGRQDRNRTNDGAIDEVEHGRMPTPIMPRFAMNAPGRASFPAPADADWHHGQQEAGEEGMDDSQAQPDPPSGRCVRIRSRLHRSAPSCRPSWCRASSLG
jgi:hypothetical protein